MDKNLLLLGAAGVGLFLLTRPGGAMAAGGPTIPQSQTRDDTGQPWPIGMQVRLPDGRIATVVPG